MSKLTYGQDTYRRIKLWNEDCQSKQERLKYWGRFDRYFRCEVHKTDCRISDFMSYCDYLNDNYS